MACGNIGPMKTGSANKSFNNAWTVFWVYFSALVLGSFQVAQAQTQKQNLSSIGSRAVIDKILVVKHDRKLYLMSKNEIVKMYEVSLGRNPVGTKEREGDKRTPEGQYRAGEHNPESQYHYSIRISYPNTSDIEKARQQGFDPGGDIMIHGLPNGMGWVGKWHLFFDWTQGCIALTNEEIKEVAEVVRAGTAIEIRP